MESSKNSKVSEASARLRKLKKPPEVYKLNEDQEEKLIELFQSFEKNLKPNLGEGKIPSKYVKLMLRAMYMEPTQEELNDIMNQLNPDDPSYISLTSLSDLVQIKMRDRSSNIELDRAFQLMDTDQKGYISIDDLRRMTKDIGETISEEEMQEMIEEASTNNDGYVTKEDFINFMNKVQSNGVER